MTASSPSRITARESAADEHGLLQRLRGGDEAAFATLVDRFGASMRRVALLYTRDRAVAEEIVQDTWLDVLRGLDSFEGRASLRTWIFTILGHRAARRVRNEERSTPFGALAVDTGPTVAPEHFFEDTHRRWPGCWTTVVNGSFGVPEERLLSSELRDVVREALNSLPDAQRTVMTLRDVEGWPSGEVCNLLAISEENQRVLLHRARAGVRQWVRAYLAERDG